MFSGSILSDERTESTEDSVNNCASPERLPAYLEILHINTSLSKKDVEQAGNTEHLNVYVGNDETYSVMAACFNNRNFAGIVIVVGVSPEQDLTNYLLQMVRLVTDKLPSVNGQTHNSSPTSPSEPSSIAHDNPVPTEDDLAGLSYFKVSEVITLTMLH